MEKSEHRMFLFTPRWQKQRMTFYIEFVTRQQDNRLAVEGRPELSC